MAKGNLFLGTAARSVGDVVMYRREGSQVSRVRVRKIANPKTEAQCRQRAYMAPIPKFFSPLAVVLERSFEGLSKAKSYAKFIKVNADKARANDWLLPKGIGFFPLPYQLSQGSLPSLSYQVLDGGNGIGLNGYTPSEAPTTVGALSDVFANIGCENGDVITLICITGSNQVGNPNYASMTRQFIVDTTSEEPVATALPGISITISSGSLAFANSAHNIVAGAFIVARFENEKWRRSSQVLNVSTSITTAISDTAYKAAAIESYSGSAGGANPMVYLDGDELDNA